MLRATFLTAAALLALGAAACQQAVVSPKGGTSLVGEWHWVSSTGGLTGNQTYTPASTGTEEKWVFRADSTYQVYATKQGTTQLTKSGTFSLGPAPSIYTGQPARALYLGGRQARPAIIEELSSTRLRLADNYPDGFGSTYER